MHEQDTQCFDGVPVTWSVSKKATVFEPTKRISHKEQVADFQESKKELTTLREKHSQIQEEHRQVTQENIELSKKFQEVKKELTILRVKHNQIQEEHRQVTQELCKKLQISQSDIERLSEEIEKNQRSNELKREKVRLIKRSRELESKVSELEQQISKQDVTMKKITHLSRRSSSNIRHTISSFENVEKDVGNAQLRSIKTTEKVAKVKDPRIKHIIDNSSPKTRHTIACSENVQKDVTNAQLRGIQSTEVFIACKDPSMKSFIEKLGGTRKKTCFGIKSEESATEDLGNKKTQYAETRTVATGKKKYDGMESEESTSEELGNQKSQYAETSNTTSTESDEQITETNGTQLGQHRFRQRQLKISHVANMSIVLKET